MKNGGFTLIELMLAVGLIAILAAIATPKFTNTIRSSQEARTKGNLAALRASISSYYTDTEGRPPIDDLASLVPRYIASIPIKLTPPYHREGNVVSAGSAASQSETAADGFGSVAGDWFYFNDPSEPQFGHVVVNCVHTDLRDRIWTNY